MSFSLTILGSSSALPTTLRYPTAQVLNAFERFFLIDCGEGTQVQLRRYKIKFSRLNRILISHLHGDHVLGLIGLISTFNLLGRKTPLHIYAHSELEKLIRFQIEFFKMDLSYDLVFHPLNFKRSQLVYEDEKIVVTSFPLKHRIPTCGFLFKEKPALPNLKKEMIQKYDIPISEMVAIKNGSDLHLENGTIIPNDQLTTPAKPARSYAFVTDTLPQPQIAELIQDVDVLYHEATFPEERAEWAQNTFHCTGKQAGEIARLANAKKLLLGHFSARYKSVADIVNEARSVFPNATAVNDGDTFEI